MPKKGITRRATSSSMTAMHSRHILKFYISMGESPCPAVHKNRTLAIPNTSNSKNSANYGAGGLTRVGSSICSSSAMFITLRERAPSAAPAGRG